MPVFALSLKSSIVSSTSFQMDKTYWGVGSAAAEQSRRKASMGHQNSWLWQVLCHWAILVLGWRIEPATLFLQGRIYYLWSQKCVLHSSLKWSPYSCWSISRGSLGTGNGPRLLLPALNSSLTTGNTLDVRICFPSSQDIILKLFSCIRQEN